VTPGAVQELRELALRAQDGATQLERQLAASLLVLAVLKATTGANTDAEVRP
jgi:hypothetical protein